MRCATNRLRRISAWTDTLAWIERIKPERAILTNMHADIDYAEIAAKGAAASSTDTGQPTVAANDEFAVDFAADGHTQPAPDNLHALVTLFPGPDRLPTSAATSGRELARLASDGYPALGFDRSEGLLAQARALYPDLTFVARAQPNPAGVAERELPQRAHLPGARSRGPVAGLMAILRPRRLPTAGARRVARDRKNDRSGA